MCCASLYVDAPLVPAGLLSRRDSFGYQLCELCGARLSRVKHHRPHGVGRACKKHSIPEKPSPSIAPVAEAVPVRSHKRKAGSDPGELLPAAAAVVASPSLPTSSSLFTHSRWLTHQCRITPGSRRARTLVTSLLALLASGELREWEEKRGGFRQHMTHKQLQC